MSRFFNEPDASGDDTIWLERTVDNPLPIMRERDLPPESRIYWPVIVAAFLKED